MILREVDNLAPVKTAENFWDNFSISFSYGKPAEPTTAEEQKQFDWTTLAIIVIIGVVIFLLLKK